MKVGFIGLGIMGKPMTQNLIKAARTRNIPVLVDPKGSNFSRYRGASLITPNLSEFEAVVGPCRNDDELVRCGERLMADLELDALLVTRSEKGMSLLQIGKPAQHLPTRAREVFDVTGAGDTVISTFGAALAAGQSLEEAMALSNLAAGIVVSKLGTATASVSELRRALRDDQEVESGVVSEEGLMKLIDEARAHGESVVMTNGCFDILHAGHVTYLEQARQLGDRLIVAVNTDESVRKLKGPDRPVNSVDRRMRMLSALQCVDWVVSFAEDTPTRLICALIPDILVKGGDNDPEQIPALAAAGVCTMVE